MTAQQTGILKPQIQKAKNQDQKVSFGQQNKKNSKHKIQQASSLAAVFLELYTGFQLTAAEHQLCAPYVAAHMLFLQLSKRTPLGELTF